MTYDWCLVMYAEMDKIYFEGTYEDCKQWLDEHYDEDLHIVSEDTGRSLSIVWT